ncbi:MAG TPA: ABC transporter substrate-binding protein, partial [Gaiellaceae bacterium]|nr:ABC transporter substrate-binding protein [Gaiellaceae bacterium]
MRRERLSLVALLAVLLLALSLAACGGDDEPEATGPIVIGWAFDGSGNMAPFDGPALAAANIRVGQINEQGGVEGRELVIETCDTQNNDPARAKACAAELLDKGAQVMFVTCDVDFATPVVQEAIG